MLGATLRRVPNEPVSPPPAPNQDPEFPRVIGRFAVLKRIGRGGFADVYLGRDPESGAFLAIKVLREELDPSIRDQVRARFLAEEAIARAIDHPAIVRIRETSARGEEPCFFAMDYVDGLSFCEYFARLRAPGKDARRRPRLAYFAEVARLGHELARAITVAHARGIVHRDLKPDNVLIVLSAGIPHVRILDFGIAKAPPELFSSDRSAAVTRYHTELGTVMGSPPYMAPEQNGGAHAVTGKADVYALGVMLLVVMLGLDTTALELVVLPAEFDARVAGQALPEALTALVRSMVDDDPERRPSMHEVALVLQRSAQSDERFALAVDAWLRRGTVPSARALVEFSRHAEDGARLTEDERAFLSRAPLERLRRTRRAALLTFGLVMLTGAGAVVARPAALLTRMAHLHTALPAAISASPSEPLPPASAPQRTLEQALDEQARKYAEQEARLHALTRELADTKRARDQSQHKLKLSEGRLAESGRALSECRSESERQGDLLAGARRDIESQLGQLAESAERLRFCTKNLREQSEERRGGGRRPVKDKSGDGAAPPLETPSAPAPVTGQQSHLLD